MKTALQTKFDLLKTATSKNVQNLQETVQAQQAYTTVLSGHIAAIHTKLVHLDKQIQIHCIYPHQHSDAVQLNTPDYDPDIDGDTNPKNAIQPLNTDTAKEEMSPAPQSQKTITPFAILPIGLVQLARPSNLTMYNSNEQNNRVTTTHS